MSANQSVGADPFLVALRDDSLFRTLGDLFEAAHVRPDEVSVSGFGATSAPFPRLRPVASGGGRTDIRWIAHEQAT